jgi:hypothetical protein
MIEKKKDAKFEINQRATVHAKLSDYCHHSVGKESDFIEVTEWTNGEGYDVHICDSVGNRSFSLTYGQLRLVKKLTKTLDTRYVK